MAELELMSLAQIDGRHLQALVDNRVAESLTLEFKRQAVGLSDSDKREFLKDVTALANTAGGTLIYGVVEEDAVAHHIEPLTVLSVDKEVLRLQSLLKDAVEPNILGVEMRDIALDAGGCVLLVRVPQSWRPPHRVTHGNVNRFYLRHSKGVFEPDTEGLRQVFNSGLEQERQLEAWRDERLERLVSGARGFKLAGNGHALVQVCSLARGQAKFQIPPIQDCALDFLPIGISSSTHRWNFDGLLLHPPLERDPSVPAYTQVFSSWSIEMARGNFVRRIEGKGVLSYALLVAFVFDAVRRSIKGMRKFGGFGPFALIVTITDLGGSRMPGEYGVSDIDRNTLRFPVLIVSSDVSDHQLQQEMLPIWDGLWQAYDRENCGDVRDAAGEWKGIPAKWLL